MKKIWLLLFVLPLISATDSVVKPTVKQLSKKWKLDKYTVFNYSEKPSKKEQKDYLYLKSNMTFSSVSEGIYEKGTWKLDTKKNRIRLFKPKEKGSLDFIVHQFTTNKLVLIIDDPSDAEAKYLKIYFKL